MAIEKDKIDEILRELPDELRDEVLKFAEDSGDPRSADNDLIDADLAREYASSHEVN
jgi:hypothetical protein